MRHWRRASAWLLAGCLALSLAACHKAQAASMWLVRTEGQVDVNDEKGQDVAIADRLGLFSGYQVGTEAESYGWIDLDEVKLTKLDQDSQVEVHKDGKKLELVVTAGSLFFDITEPLKEDEELTIRSANMVTAIRGTSGWVTVESENNMSVWILDGTVECSVQDENGEALATQPVTAWERASLSAEAGQIGKTAFTEDDIPSFIRTERGLPETNAYGATIFELREDYLDYYAMPEDFQAAVQRAVEGLEARDRALLADTMTIETFSPYCESREGYGGEDFLRFYTKYEGRKLRVEIYSDSEHTHFGLEVHSENGPGLAFESEIDFDPDGSVNFWRYIWGECPCVDWQMEGQAVLLTEEGFSPNLDTVELTQEEGGAVVHNLRDGHWTGDETDYDQGREQGAEPEMADIVMTAMGTGRSADDLTNIYW